MAKVNRVKLKNPNEIDFNKKTGQYHFQYENLKDKIGLKKIFIIHQEYNFYGVMKYHLKDLKGNFVTSFGQLESLSASMFKLV